MKFFIHFRFTKITSRFIRSTVTLMFVFLSMQSISAERIPLRHLSLHDLQQMSQVLLPDEPSIVSRPFVHSFRFVSKHTDQNQVQHLRFQQEYRGYPVLGGFAIIHRHAKEVVSLNGTFYRGLDDELGQPRADFVEESRRVLAKFIALYQPQGVLEQQVTPLVYLDEQHHAYWAYQVSALVQPTDAAPSRPSAIVDADTGLSIEIWDDLKTMRHQVKGVGFGGNQRIGLYQFGEQWPLLEILRDDFSGLCYMENKQVKVIDMNFGYEKVQTPMIFDCPTISQANHYWTGYEGDGYDFQNGAYSPSNDAMYIGSVIKQVYRHEYGVEALGNTHRPKQLIMRVHYGKHYSNAYWDAGQMTFGDGNDEFYPLVSLGIGAHEVSHGFTEQYSNLAYYGQSGAMNESFSDMAAQAAEYYANQKSSWLIGAEIFKEDKPFGALRFMDKPSVDGFSIDTADKYRKGIDVHYASGVYNRLFYLLSNMAGWDPSKAFRVMVKANMDYWTPKSTFVEGACGVLFAAEDLEYPVDDIKKVLDQVRIDYQGC